MRLVIAAAVFAGALWVTRADAGWYLIAPPINERPAGTSSAEHLDRERARLRSVPKSDWGWLRAYDSAEACEAGRKAEGQRRVDQRRADAKAHQITWMIQGLWAECVASDDPRLAEDPGPRLYEQLAPLVVVVIGRDAQGQGWHGSGMQAAPGLILTNYHVLKGATGAEVIYRSGARIPVAGVIADDPNADLVLVSLAGDPGRWPAGEPTWSNTLPRVGEAVWAIGAPQGLAWTFTRGTVAQLQQDAKAGTLILFTAPIAPGSSGGPLINDRGEILGFVRSMIRGAQILNQAVPHTAVDTLTLAKRVVPLPEWRGSAR